MATLAPLVVADYTVRPSKGGRKFEGFGDRKVYSTCEVLFGHVAAQGFDAAAICAMFAVREVEISDLLKENGLDRLGERPLRILSRANAWSLVQIQYLLSYWHAGVTVAGIAQRIHRSAGSVRYKARSLGLPKRDQKGLVATPPRLLPPLATLQHRSWNCPDEIRLGEEHLRGIDTRASANRLRRDLRHVECSVFRLILPNRNKYRGTLTKTEFNPDDPYLPEFRGMGWRYAKCAMTENWFWTHRNGPRLSVEFKRSALYRNMVSAGELAAEY